MLENQQQPSNQLEQRSSHLSSIDEPQDAAGNRPDTPLEIEELPREEHINDWKCNISDIPDFNKVIGGGIAIPRDGYVTLYFSQEYLQMLCLEDAHKKVQDIAEYSKKLLACGPAVKIMVADFDLENIYGRLVLHELLKIL